MASKLLFLIKLIFNMPQKIRLFDKYYVANSTPIRNLSIYLYFNFWYINTYGTPCILYLSQKLRQYFILQNICNEIPIFAIFVHPLRVNYFSQVFAPHSLIRKALAKQAKVSRIWPWSELFPPVGTNLKFATPALNNNNNCKVFSLFWKGWQLNSNITEILTYKLRYSELND